MGRIRTRADPRISTNLAWGKNRDDGRYNQLLQGVGGDQVTESEYACLFDAP